MTIDEQQKNQLALTFQGIVRQRQIKADAQRLTMAFRMVVDQLEPDEPIALQALVDYLLHEAKVPERDALELCVILQSRQEKLGVTFVPPRGAELLGPEAIEHILAEFNQRADAPAWEPKRGGEPGSGSGPQTRATTGSHPRSGTGPHLRAPPRPAASPPPSPTRAPKSAPSPRASPKKALLAAEPRTKRLAGAFAAIAVLAAAFFIYRSQTATPTLKETKLAVVDGLPCVQLLFDGTTGICTMPKAQWASSTSEALQAQASATKDALVERGGSKLYVRSMEDNKILLSR